MALTEYTPPTAVIATANLDQLAAIANEAHDRVEVALGNLRDIFKGSCIDAMSAGDALLRAKSLVPEGQWLQWVAANLHYSNITASHYMRIAFYRDEVEQWMAEGGNGTIVGARSILAELPKVYGKKAMMKDTAKELHNSGYTIAQIARDLDCSWATAKGWVDDQFEKRKLARQISALRRKREAERALAQQELARAVRKVGGKPDQAFSMLREKLIPLVDGMLGEETDPEARQALREALAAAHRCEDQIVRALRLARRIG